MSVFNNLFNIRFIFKDGEDPRNAKLDVKSFKFLLKSREKDSLLLGAAERSPIYTSHEHVLIKVKGKFSALRPGPSMGCSFRKYLNI